MGRVRKAAKQASAKRPRQVGRAKKPLTLSSWIEAAGDRHDKRLLGLWDALSLDVRHKDYLPPAPDDYHWALLTHCYVMVEAAYHCFAASDGYQTFVHKRDDGSHWWLQHPDTGRILDPSWPQLTGPYPYHLGHRQQLVPPTPSKRAREIIERSARKQRGQY